MNQLFVSESFVSGRTLKSVTLIFRLFASCHVTRKATSKCSCMISYRATAGTLAPGSMQSKQLQFPKPSLSSQSPILSPEGTRR